MVSLLKTPVRLGGTLLASALLATAWGAIARPGTVNYAEGQVTLDGSAIGAKQIGQMEVDPGHVLQTANGKAEMLLTPGVFLRLGENSAVKMVSPSLIDTRVELLHGEALLEVDQIQKENNLNVVDHDIPVRIEKQGVYDFQANPPTVAVYDGKAVAQVNDRSIEVGKNKELALDAVNPKLKPQKFDRHQTDELYAWSKLRSGYLADVNASSAQMIFVNSPGWWAGTGWYWNPWFSTWAFVPGSGFLYSPFGYSFYSPAYWVYARPLYYRPGVFPGRPVGAPIVRPAPVGTALGAPRASFSAPAFSHGGGAAPHFGGGRR
jgi:hypothetical protein